jgi:hypothetical protein
VEKEHFWSELKQQGISDEDYRHLEKIWVEKGFKTMKDLLIWYNNLDVEPFLGAAEKMFQHWKELGIDMFKGSAISLPGLALCYMMKKMTPHSILPLCGSKTKEFYQTLRDNITGGLSIVGHRYHETDVTDLPNGTKCKWIYSHDANALYLYALGQPTGTGVFAFWLPTNTTTSIESLPWKRTTPEQVNEWHRIKQFNMLQRFEREYAEKYWKSEVEWLEWTSEAFKVKVEHKYNGRQKVIHVDKKTSFPVDGYIPEHNTILQFHGCHWHGHECQPSNSEMIKRRKDTESVTGRLRDLGYTVVEKWECDWNNTKAKHSTIRNFIKEHLSLPSRVNESNGWELIDSIKNDQVFGMIECDIEVPWWNEELIQRFKEYPPIFKNTNVSIDDIGPFMKEYAENNGYMKQPKRMLINSYWGRKILLATPLVKWYLANGLEITRIYRVVEMKAKRCFQPIVDEIAEHRRIADQDPAHKPQAESWKTVGNSCYGKAMTNKEKHKETVIK